MLPQPPAFSDFAFLSKLGVGPRPKSDDAERLPAACRVTHVRVGAAGELMDSRPLFASGAKQTIRGICNSIGPFRAKCGCVYRATATRWPGRRKIGGCAPTLAAVHQHDPVEGEEGRVQHGLQGGLRGRGRRARGVGGHSPEVGDVGAMYHSRLSQMWLKEEVNKMRMQDQPEVAGWRGQESPTTGRIAMSEYLFLKFGGYDCEAVCGSGYQDVTERANSKSMLKRIHASKGTLQVSRRGLGQHRDLSGDAWQAARRARGAECGGGGCAPLSCQKEC